MVPMEPGLGCEETLAPSEGQAQADGIPTGLQPSPGEGGGALSHPPAQWQVLEFRGRAGLGQVEPDWRRIYGAMERRTCFHAYEACVAYVDNLMAEPDRLRCLVLSDGRRARAICPLEPRLERRLGPAVRVWRVLAHHEHLADVICADDAARRALLPAILDHLRRGPDGCLLLALGPAPVGSVLWEGLGGEADGNYCLDRNGCAVGLDCRSSFAEVAKGLPGKFRYSLGVTRRRLDALAGVRFVTVRDSPGFEAEFQDFLALEASGWKGKAGSAILSSPRKLGYFAALAATLRGTVDYCEINSLHAEGRCIASTFATRTGRTYVLNKSAYDEAYAHLSPGKLLFAQVMERCCSDPELDWFDQVSDVPWMRGWRREVVDLQLGILNLGGWRGRWLIRLLKLRFGALRRIARRLQPVLGRLGIHRDDPSTP